MAIKVLVYDDNETLRTSIEALLLAEDDFELLAVSIVGLEEGTG